MLLAVTALSIGCGGSDTESNSTAPTTAANQVSFDVTGMTWATACGAAVRETLAGLDGVDDVKVDFPNKTATCTIDPDKFDSDGAVAALKAANFPSTVKE